MEPLLTGASSIMNALPPETKFAGSIRASIFNGKPSTSTSLFQTDPVKLISSFAEPKPKECCYNVLHIQCLKLHLPFEVYYWVQQIEQCCSFVFQLTLLYKGNYNS